MTARPHTIYGMSNSAVIKAQPTASASTHVPYPHIPSIPTTREERSRLPLLCFTPRTFCLPYLAATQQTAHATRAESSPAGRQFWKAGPGQMSAPMDGLSLSEEACLSQLRQRLQRDVNCLSDPDRSTRRRALTKLQKAIFQEAKVSLFSQFLEPHPMVREQMTWNKA